VLVAETDAERSVCELSDELAQTKLAVDRLRRQVDGLCDDVAHVSADVQATLRLLLLLSPSNNSGARRPMSRRDRAAAALCRGFSDTSAAADSPRHDPTGRQPVGILKNSAMSSAPKMHRVDFASHQRTVDKDYVELMTPAAAKNNVSNCRLADDSSSSSSAGVSAAVRLGHSLLRSSTSPQMTRQHRMTSVMSADGQHAQTLLTTNTAGKYGRGAVTAGRTTSSTDRDSGTVATTDL